MLALMITKYCLGNCAVTMYWASWKRSSITEMCTSRPNTRSRYPLCQRLILDFRVVTADLFRSVLDVHVKSGRELSTEHYLLWPSQWLVTHGYHLTVTVYLHVATSTHRHITSLSIYLKFYHLSSILNSQFTSSTLTLWLKTIFNGGCYWEGLMAFLSGPLSGAICCSCLHRLELLRQAQEKDGNSGH